MALQGDATRGVRLADIWSAFCERGGSVVNVAARAGWPEPVVGTIEGYRGVEERYSFSTAREVTGISGRGVGMDVVKTNIENIGGTVGLTSRGGLGTAIRIGIPGLAVRSGPR